jgi:hypothetical protein
MSNRYLYMVSYRFEGGYGRAFLDTQHPLDSRDRVMEAECMIAEDITDREVSHLCSVNIVLLREGAE